MKPLRHCPALFIAAPASGQGKTTITAALARRHRRAGRSVRIFKTGPDYLDPTILAAASGAPVHTLDLWMAGDTDGRRRLWQAAGEADLILIEGAMGLHDGEPSGADLAIRLGVPVLLVIDASAMAQTFAAIALGLARYRPALQLAGVFANRIGGAGHAALLEAALPAGMPMLGWIAQDEAIVLPERHLGLHSADELPDLAVRLDAVADLLSGSPLAALPREVGFAAPDAAAAPARLLAGRRIAIARDAAFRFAYPANIELLEQLGARLSFFSPLADCSLPECDALWLPGGYPELHAARLAENDRLRTAIRRHHEAGKPILGECGGLLYLADSLIDGDGARHRMLGLLPGEARLHKRLLACAMQEADLPAGKLRGHSFHHASFATDRAPLLHASCPHGGRTAEPMWQIGNLSASFFHAYFPSCPAAAAALFA